MNAISKPVDLGPVIKAARRRTGWSQRGLATYAGVSQANLSGIENGKWGPSLSTFLRIAPLLGMAMIVIDKQDL